MCFLVWSYLEVKNVTHIVCTVMCTVFFRSRLSFNRFIDVLGIQLACSDCIFIWIIFQSCLNLVQLYFTFQTSEKNNWLELDMLKKRTVNLMILYLNIAHNSLFIANDWIRSDQGQCDWQCSEFLLNSAWAAVTHRQTGVTSVLFRKSGFDQFLHNLGLLASWNTASCTLHNLKKIEFDIFKILHFSFVISFRLLFAEFKYVRVPEAYRCWVSSLTFMNGSDI